LLQLLGIGQGLKNAIGRRGNLDFDDDGVLLRNNNSVCHSLESLLDVHALNAFFALQIEGLRHFFSVVHIGPLLRVVISIDHG